MHFAQCQHPFSPTSQTFLHPWQLNLSTAKVASFFYKCFNEFILLNGWLLVQTLHVEHNAKQPLVFGQVKYPFFPLHLKPQLLHMGGFFKGSGTILKKSSACAEHEYAVGSHYFIIV
jgi:hypothetical protein